MLETTKSWRLCNISNVRTKESREKNFYIFCYRHTAQTKARPERGTGQLAQAGMKAHGALRSGALHAWPLPVGVGMDGLNRSAKNVHSPPTFHAISVRIVGEDKWYLQVIQQH